LDSQKAANNAPHRRFRRVGFNLSMFSLDGVLDLKFSGRNLNAP
jgi:hypothetical protein